MNFKYDPGDCSCCDSTPCCNSKTTDCGSSYDPQERCCCVCASAPPCEIDVTIAGIVTETGGCGGFGERRMLANCTNCANYNGTYSLQKYWSNNTPADGSPAGHCEWWGFFNCNYDSSWPRCTSCSTGHELVDQINMIQFYIQSTGKLWCRIWTAASANFNNPNGDPAVTNWCDAGFGSIKLPDTDWRLDPFFSSAALTYIGQADESGDDYDCDFSNISLSPEPSTPWHNGTNFCDWTGVTVSVSAG